MFHLIIISQITIKKTIHHNFPLVTFPMISSFHPRFLKQKCLEFAAQIVIVLNDIQSIPNNFMNLGIPIIK